MPPRRRPKITFSNTQFKKRRKAVNQSSQLLAEWEGVEEDWCENECNTLSQALTQSASTSALDNDHTDFMGIDHDPLPFDGDFERHTNESDVETTYSDQSEESLESFRGASVPVRGDINRKRRIREDRQWAEAIESMFKAFMKCKHLTRQWSHPETWNQDYKSECRCSLAKKCVRQMELYDILS